MNIDGVLFFLGALFGTVLGIFLMLTLTLLGAGDWRQGPFHIEKCYSPSLNNVKVITGEPKFKVYEGGKTGNLCYKVAN